MVEYASSKVLILESWPNGGCDIKNLFTPYGVIVSINT